VLDVDRVLSNLSHEFGFHGQTEDIAHAFRNTHAHPRPFQEGMVFHFIACTFLTFSTKNKTARLRTFTRWMDHGGACVVAIWDCSAIHG
jgi:hypothetical protein